jgi:hypothetical protein
VSVVCFKVEVSASGWSLVQRSPTECGMSDCDHEALSMRTPWPTGRCCAIGKKITYTKFECLKVISFSDVTPWSLLNIYRFFVATDCLHFWDKCGHVIEAVGSAETLQNSYQQTQCHLPQGSTLRYCVILTQEWYGYHLPNMFMYFSSSVSTTCSAHTLRT